MNRIDTLTNLAPRREPLDPQWSAETLAAIMAEPVAARRRAPRRRLVLAFAPVAVAGALALALGPSLVGSTVGASASAAEVLTRGAAKLDATTPGPGEYLHVQTMTTTHVKGVPTPTIKTGDDVVAADGSRPMVALVPGGGPDSGDIQPSAAAPADDLYRDPPTSSDALLDALASRADARGTAARTHDAMAWDQAFRELQDPEVPVAFKVDVLQALTDMPGVTTTRAARTSGGLVGTAVVHRDDPVAFVFDDATGEFLGITYGVDHPAGYDGDVRWTWTYAAAVVPAPGPDTAG